MDSRIDELLKRYWNCETSLEEEEELRAMFRNGEIPEPHKDVAEMFRYFDRQKEHGINDVVFDQAIAEKTGMQKRGMLVSLMYNSMRIAAGIAVLVLAIWLVRTEIRNTADPVAASEEDTYDDPQLAFEETKKALMMISKSFQNAEDKARNINLLNEAKEQVQRDDNPSQL